MGAIAIIVYRFQGQLATKEIPLENLHLPDQDLHLAVIIKRGAWEKALEEKLNLLKG